MKPSEIIVKLNSDNSRLFKESVVKENVYNKEFVEGLRYCLDSLVTFGIKAVPVKKETNSAFDVDEIEGLTWEEFKVSLEKFKNRELTGNVAKDEVLRLMNKSEVSDWNNWYRLILIKDLKCGVSEKTINKVLPEADKIPVFSCQLAQDSTDVELS
jgi:DNA ligase-1